MSIPTFQMHDLACLDDEGKFLSLMGLPREATTNFCIERVDFTCCVNFTSAHAHSCFRAKTRLCRQLPKLCDGKLRHGKITLHKSKGTKVVPEQLFKVQKVAKCTDECADEGMFA